METIDLKQTIDYLKELEEQLYEFELSDTEMTLEMHDLYKLIEQLMDLTFTTTDKTLKVKYAVVEKKARDCYNAIKVRLAVEN